MPVGIARMRVPRAASSRRRSAARTDACGCAGVRHGVRVQVGGGRHICIDRNCIINMAEAAGATACAEEKLTDVAALAAKRGPLRLLIL